VKTQIHPFTLRHQKPKIACSFFPGLRCTRYIVKKGIVEAPYQGLLIFHPLRGGFLMLPRLGHRLYPHKPLFPATLPFRTQYSTSSQQPSFNKKSPLRGSRSQPIPISTIKTPRCGSFALICTKHLVSPRGGMKVRRAGRMVWAHARQFPIIFPIDCFFPSIGPVGKQISISLSISYLFVIHSLSFRQFPRNHIIFSRSPFLDGLALKNNIEIHLVK
jgi:hypothetical protein